MKFVTPSPVQAQTIPLMLAGKDVIAKAQTGTGKTAAFALPALQNIELERQQKLLMQEIEDTQREVVFTMGAIGETRSKETGPHVQTCGYCFRINVK